MYSLLIIIHRTNVAPRSEQYFSHTLPFFFKYKHFSKIFFESLTPWTRIVQVPLMIKMSAYHF